MSDNFRAELQAIVERIDLNFRAHTQRGIESILEAGVTAYDDLIAVLQNDANIEICTTACWVLARFHNKKAVPAIVSILKHKEPNLRIAAAQSLGVLGSKQAVRPLIDTLVVDENIEVCELAAYSLGLIGGKQAFDTLVSILSDQTKDPKIRGAAAEALALVGDRRAVAPLIAALKDVSVDVRFWAIYALGELGDPQALPELRRLAVIDKGILPGWWAINKEATEAIESIQDRLIPNPG